MGAAQDQAVHPRLAHGQRVLFHQRLDGADVALFDGPGQSLAGLSVNLGSAPVLGQQGSPPGAAKGRTRGPYTHSLAVGLQDGRLDARLDAHDRNLGKRLAQGRQGGGRGGVAGHHQQLGAPQAQEMGQLQTTLL